MDAADLMEWAWRALLPLVPTLPPCSRCGYPERVMQPKPSEGIVLVGCPHCGRVYSILRPD